MISRRYALVGGLGTMKKLIPILSAVLALTAAAGERPRAEARQIYRSFMPALPQTAAFARLGITTRCFLVSEDVIDDGYPAVWRGEGEYDFAAFDSQVADILKVSPTAKLVCIIDLNTPRWLKSSGLPFDSHNEISTACASGEWKRQAEAWLRAMIEYAEAKYGDRIISYMLSAGGGLSEWFECDDGRANRIKNTAWRAWEKANGVWHGEACPPETDLAKAALDNLLYDPATEQAKIDYWRFYNDIIADTVLGFLRITRESIAPEKEIGLFFGYSVKRGQVLSSFGHADVERVFDSPDFDWVAAPGTYSDRKIGGGTGSQLVPLALELRGKRFLHEIDHRPHDKADHPRFALSNRAKDDPLGFKDDVAGYTREFAYALVKHASLWWFDMRGGWFDAPEVMDRIAHLKTIYDRLGSDDSKSSAEVLMVLDPRSFFYINNQDPKCVALSSVLRKALNHAAAVPFDICYFDDLKKIDLKQYRLVLMPTAFELDAARRAFLKEKVLCDGRYVAWTFAPGVTDGKTMDVARVEELAGVPFRTPGVAVTPRGGWTAVYAYTNELYTAQVIADIESRAGVHAYLDGPETPVFANERLLAVHTAKGGKRTIRLRQRVAKVVELVSGMTVAENAAAFDYTFEEPDSRIFEIIR